jgi:hypothetical protein
MGYLIIVFGFLLLGWFGAKLIAIGREAMKTRTMEIGLGYRFEGRSASRVGVVLIVAGIVVIVPFVCGMTLLAINVVKGYFSGSG